MSINNKKYTDNKTGLSGKVLDTIGEFAILENIGKVNITDLLNSSNYTEEIDADNFFSGTYNNLVSQISTINTENINEYPENINRSVKIIEDISGNGGIYTPTSFMSLEEEKAELARKYNLDINSAEAANRQMEGFNKILNPETQKEQSFTRNNVSQYNVPEDPVTIMFKNTKRSVNFDMNINYKNKIPRLDFIEMMEDSYNISIIDCLASEFTNEILSNPKFLEDSIRAKIKEMVYKKTKTTKSKTTKAKVKKDKKEEDKKVEDKGGNNND